MPSIRKPSEARARTSDIRTAESSSINKTEDAAESSAAPSVIGSAFTIRFPTDSEVGTLSSIQRQIRLKPPSSPSNPAGSKPSHHKSTHPFAPGLPGGNDPIVAPARTGSRAWGMSTDLPGRQTAREPKIERTRTHHRTTSDPSRSVEPFRSHRTKIETRADSKQTARPPLQRSNCSTHDVRFRSALIETSNANFGSSSCTLLHPASVEAASADCLEPPDVRALARSVPTHSAG